MIAKPRLAAALAAALLLPALAAAQSNVYRWVDKDGKVHYSDTPPPEPTRNVSQKRLGGGYVQETQLPYATQIAMRRNPVVLFTGTDCADPCRNGRELLAKRGIPFTERDAQANPADGEALTKLIGSLDVPLLVVGENKVKGFESGSWDSALDGAGYPRTALPGQAQRAAPLKNAEAPPAAPGAPR